MKYFVANIVMDFSEHINDIFWEKFITYDDNVDCKVQWQTKPDKKHLSYDVSLFDNLFCIENDFLLVDSLWENANIVFNSSRSENLYTILLQVFYAKAIYKQIIQIHSSLVKYKDKGILFVGPSGIGKTTQAELWKKYNNCLIINGDMVFLEKKEKEFIGWGTPWHGSSYYCENTSVPIVALIVLKQGKQNKIRKLKGFEKIKNIGQQIYYPGWIKNGTEMAIDILDQLLLKVPIYELTNKADEESVELVKQEIFGDE